MRCRLASAGAATRTDRDTVRVGDLEVDRTPVTNARYARFVAATGHRAPLFWPGGRMPALLADHPVVGVDFFDAVAFAQWTGGSLPTELEWVEASGLSEHRAYVWGDAFDSARCNTVRSGRKGTTPVGSFPDGIAPSGCVDLCGNVWELTCSADPRQPLTVLVKGGSWYDFPCHAKIDTSFNARIHKASSTVGFRLVYGRGLRLPAFLDRDLVARSIAWRRAGPEDEAFSEVRNELRGRADGAPAVLPEAAPLWSGTLAVEEALRVLDTEPRAPSRTDAGDAPDRVENPIPVRAVAYAARMAVWFGNGIQRHPHAVGWTLLAAVGVVVGLLWTTARADATHGHVARAAGAPAGIPSGIPSGAPAIVTLAPPEAVAPTPVEWRREDRVTAALADLRSGDAPARERAEEFLIRNADLSESVVSRALERARGVEERASLRYVLTTIEEERSPVSRPLILRRPPTQGLVLFLREIDEGTAPVIALARRTAIAERTPFAVVHGGGRAAEEIIDLHALDLGAISLYCDDDGGFAGRCALDDAPLAVVGLRADASLAFIHRGAIARGVLAARVRMLR